MTGLPSRTRRAEIDILRTIAILGMVVYHASFDVWLLNGTLYHVQEIGWWLLARSVATLFLLLAGCSSVLSLAGKTSQERWRTMWRRCVRIGAAAAAVSLATYVAAPEDYVRFGILHLIAVGSIILTLTVDWGHWTGVLGVTVLAIGRLMLRRTVETHLLLPLGLVYPEFASMDYFPLFPWLGVMLLGQWLGWVIYVRHSPPLIAQSQRWKALTLPGRYSLTVYLLHQPLILGLLWLVW